MTGVAGIVGGVAGCVESPDDPGDPGSGDSGDGDGEPEPVKTTLIGSGGAGSSTIRGGPNLHLATLNSTYNIYRSQQPLNDEYVYFAEISATFTPQQGAGYKGNLIKATVTVKAFEDNLRLIKADPENERYVLDEREKSESYNLGLSVRESGANVGYSNSYRTHDGVVYPADIVKGRGGNYTIGWDRGNADVYTPIHFYGLVTFRSSVQHDNLSGWRIGHKGKAEADQNIV